jgi:predicted aconitase
MMRLSQDEQEMLEGKEGPARQKAIELLVKYAEGLGSDRFVDTHNATVIVGSIPDVKIVQKVVPSFDADEIASKFLLDSDETVVLDKVKPFTATNTTFRYQRYPDLQRGGKFHCNLLQKMVDYIKRVGVIHLATYTPYKVGNIPMKGEHSCLPALTRKRIDHGAWLRAI